MDYSIIIPAFNKAELTRNCLNALQASLAGAGHGEVIVIDNASSDHTPSMLAEFDWVKLVRNERNTGFAAANNQGARLASGEFLVLLNNDTEAQAGWLAAMLRTARETNAGAVGARLVYANGTVQHAGVVITQERFGRAGFTPFHDLQGAPATHPHVLQRHDFQAVTAACLLTPRSLYLETGGLDEAFWNGYEDIDYCLRLRAMGRQIVYEPAALLVHLESQSGPQRFRRAAWNIGLLADRWNGEVRFDANEFALARGLVARRVRLGHGFTQEENVAVPKTTLVVHGRDRAGDRAFVTSLHDNHAPVERVVFVQSAAAVQAVREQMEVRGDRYLALVDARAELQPFWLDELVLQLQFAPASAAATFAPELPLGEDVAVPAADARCTLLHLAKFPQHERLGEFDTLDGALADFLLRGITARAGTRGVRRIIAALPACARDARFEEAHGMSVAHALTGGAAAIEAALRRTPGRRPGLVSIVMLSWNAPQFTKMALESIREHTHGKYEIVIVDNGSRPETVDWLKTLEGVRILYNDDNRGYAGGNNQAIAAARGEYVVLLNNDVIVTAGWLDRLLHAFDRIPGLGVCAPRSNKIAGDQVVVDASYADLVQMHAYAAERTQRYRDRGYVTDRAIGLCLCIDRRVIEEVGGIDERFGVGNFEDDDFCLRVRAAGYRIFVCDDVFIHHFGSQTFAANNVDWTATMRENWPKFARKWALPDRQEGGGYTPAAAIRRGFDRERHYVPLPGPPLADAAAPAKEYALIFTAPVRDEREWQDAGAFARRYLRAFASERPVLLAIAAFGTPDARTIGARIERFAHREGIDLAAAADIDVSDAADEEAWLNALPAGARISVGAVADRSPSGLRRHAEALFA
ncbi:MAG: glycosyltransferase family 2 protein [Candidatus Baltobacteraceae bacterium]